MKIDIKKVNEVVAICTKNNVLVGEDNKSHVLRILNSFKLGDLKQDKVVTFINLSNDVENGLYDIKELTAREMFDNGDNVWHVDSWGDSFFVQKDDISDSKEREYFLYHNRIFRNQEEAQRWKDIDAELMAMRKEFVIGESNYYVGYLNGSASNYKWATAFYSKVNQPYYSFKIKSWLEDNQDNYIFWIGE